MRTDAKPADAWWDEKEKEWVHGARDARGRLVGEVRYWNTDGVLISTAEHVDGKPHGIARRYYANGEVSQDSHYVDGLIDGVRRFVRPTGNIPMPDQLRDVGTKVAAYVCIYERGDLIGTTWHDRDGREVDRHGRPAKPRPPTVEPTAFFMPDGWIYMRRRGENGSEIVESREYYRDGSLKEESIYATGVERGWYKNGQSSYEGRRRRVGQGHIQIGEWRHYDAKGRLRRIARYENGDEVWRRWHRTKREAKAGGTTREGAVERGCEIGVWIVRDDEDVIAELDLGPFTTDPILLEHAVTAELLDDAIDPQPADRSIVAMIARARRAGTSGDLAKLDFDDTPPWRVVDDAGKLVAIHDHPGYHDSRITLLAHALRWGPPEGEILAGLAVAFLEADRAQAALDIIDAALLTASVDDWTQLRHAALRALGRGVEVAHPTTLDDRARVLLEDIRANPDDDGPRLVYADHVASIFPEHTALIVAQCNGKSDRSLVAAMRASLPDWLRHDYNEYTRGFVENFAYADAEAFVNADPDLLYRVAPTARRVELSYATGYIAQLVTMPSLRRFTELAFNDTHLSRVQTEQLGRCPHLEQLGSLGLYNTSLSDEALLPILRSTAFPKLSSLNLGNGRDEQDYGLAGLTPILDAAFASTLGSLTVCRRWMTDGLVDVIVGLPALDDVDASGNNLGDDGMAALAACKRRFMALELANNNIGPAGCRALASLEVWTLNLRNNPITDAGVAALATSTSITHLELEGVWNQPLGNASVEALARGPIANSLQQLVLDRTTIDDAGMRVLSAAPFPKLVNLTLTGTLRDAAFFRSAFLPRLKWLDVSGVSLADEAIAGLCDADTHAGLILRLGRGIDPALQNRLKDRFGTRVHFAS